MKKWEQLSPYERFVVMWLMTLAAVMMLAASGSLIIWRATGLM